MTQLFIDGQEVVLPADFNCKSISENPIFTKSGDYTLNITLSLLNPINSQIFKHINRINSLSRFDNRTAILVSDTDVIIKGKEVLLQYSNISVDIQIVAGNSSLNYLIGNNLNLRDLNLGAATIDKNQVIPNLKKDYPLVDFQILPFYDPINKFVGNRYTFTDVGGGNWGLKYAHDGSIVSTLFLKEDESEFYEYWEWWPNMRYPTSYDNYRPQPYLGAIVKKLFSSLGYVLDNAIEQHHIYKYAYIVHSNDTLEYAKMLPSWTVSKFLEEIESIFDCTLVVDNNSMHARIIFNHNYYTDSLENNLIMLDDFDVTVNESDEKMTSEMNIKYNLQDTEYYRYQNIPESLTKDLPIIKYESSVDKTNINNITNLIGGKTADSVKKGAQPVYESLSLKFIEFIENDIVIAKAVNDYTPLKKNDTDDFDKQLDIIPAEFFVKPWKQYDFNSGSSTYYSWQLPVAKNANSPLISEGSDLTKKMIQDVINDNHDKDDSDNITHQISIAFYKSSYSIVYEDGVPVPASNNSMPFSFVRSISERVKYSDKYFQFFDTHNGSYINPLSLNFLDKELYSKSNKIDRSTIYKIRFISNGLKINPRDIFIINNRKFYCRKFERNITIDGFDEIVEGEFYSEKI